MLKKTFLTLLAALTLATSSQAAVINGPLIKAGLEPLSTDPSSVFAGRIYFDTDTLTAKVYTGTQWVGLAPSASGTFTSPTFSGTVTFEDLTTGLLHSNSSGVISSSLINDGDVSASAGIVDTKLATISTSGKVSNSATTATSANTNSAIVARDSSGDFSAGTITATLTGNASTATALASNPSDCAASNFATSIDASGNLTCAQVGDADLSTSYIKADGTRGLSANWNAGAHTITATTFIGALTGNSSTATALASNPSDCSSNNYATAIDASGNLTCGTVTDSGLATSYVKADGTRGLSANWNAGAFSITATSFVGALTGNSSTATALAANPSDCSAGQKATAIDASGNLTCSSVSLTADVANVLPIANGGTSGGTKTAGFDALAPTSVKGDQIVHDGTNNIKKTVGTDGQVWTADSASTGGVKWADPANTVTASYELSNVGVSASVGSSALTIALKQSDGSTNCSSGASACKIGFRSSTSATGGYSQRSVTGALSLVISSGSTLGLAAATAEYIYLYAIDNAGTVELAASTNLFIDQGAVVTTTAEGGAGAADSRNVLYSSTARSNVAARLLARLKATEATPGTWATAPAEIALWPFPYTSVWSGSTTMERIERVKATAVCSSGTCALASSTPGITSVAFNSTGNYTLNYTGFSAAPTCTCTANSNPKVCHGMDSSPGATSWLFGTWDVSTNTRTNSSFEIICVGPR